MASTEAPPPLHNLRAVPIADGPTGAPLPARELPKPSPIELLLKLEADARRVESVRELTFLIANESLGLVHARQIFVVRLRGRGPCVEAATSIGSVDRDAPRIRWIEGMVRALGKDVGLQAVREFTLPAYCPEGDEEHRSFPFGNLVWVPLTLRDGKAFGGLLLAREIPWAEADITVATRLAGTFGHAWTALTGQRKLPWRVRPRLVLASVALCLVAAGFYPVPLSVLAPAEISPVEPRIVAAPFDGVVDAIEVEPNAPVQAGQLVLRMSDTSLRNELSVAEQNVQVAAARLRQVTQGAVADARVRGGLAIAQTELELATAKRTYAREMLQRSRVNAPAAGIAIYGDKREWIGRPVATGERLMQIADPLRTELRIDVPVADAIAVEAGARVRAFLDSDPLRPVHAQVRAASFEAQRAAGDALVYRIYATLDAGHGLEPGVLRPGVRGTAQVIGADVPLAFYVFRRPVAALRQRLGW